MLRSNLSLWFSLINAILIGFVLVHNVEMKKSKLHMGILETRPKYLAVKNIEQVQPGPTSPVTDYESFQRLQCSYALSAVRHLLLTEELLYNPNKEFIYNPNHDLVLFDAEAVLMLATVQSMPDRVLVSDDILWTLWFYTDKVHRLLDTFSKGETVEPGRTQFMFGVHQSVVESLRLFVDKTMGNFEDAQKKLHEINIENIFSGINLNATISRNKKLLSRQMTFNERYGVSTDGIKHISFNSITHFDKLDKIERIVIEYFGEIYWTNVKQSLYDMYVAATSVDIMISYQIIYLWHINNGIMKILKLILIKFIESYLDFTSKEENVEKIKSLDQTMNLNLSEFYECVGDDDLLTYLLIQKFNNRYVYPNFYNAVRRDINYQKKVYPICTNCPDNLTENISRYYLLLNDESSKRTSAETQEFTNIDYFLEKVKDLFSDVNMVIVKSFYSYPFHAKILKKLKDIEHLARA